MSGALPEDLRSFIVDHISSVVQLEALLLLRRTGTEWTVEALARELRIDSNATAEQLAGLCSGGLIAHVPDPPRYRYAPRDDALERLVARMAGAYDDRRVTVISLIYSAPRDHLRVFADAFRFRRDDSDG
jgi:hypothetical protein